MQVDLPYLPVEGDADHYTRRTHRIRLTGDEALTLRRIAAGAADLELTLADGREIRTVTDALRLTAELAQTAADED